MTADLGKYDFSHKDYAVHFDGHTLSIDESEKKLSGHKTAITIADLDEHITTIGEQRIDNGEELESFIESFSIKVEETILERHTWFGNIIVFAQRFFGLGALGKLEKLKNRVHHLEELPPQAERINVEFHAADHAPQQARPPAARRAVKVAKGAKQRGAPVVQAAPTARASVSREPLRAALGLDDSASLDAIKGALKEKLEEAGGKKWLLEVLKNDGLYEASVQLILQMLPRVGHARVADRFTQLKASSFEERGHLSTRELLHIASFIELQIDPVTRATKEFFTKGERGLARAVQFDWSKKHVYVIADRNHSLIDKGTGAFKVPVTVAKVAFEVLHQPAEVAAQLSGGTVEQLQREADYFTKHLKDVPGLAEFYTCAPYREGNIDQMSMMFKLAAGDLQKLQKRNVHFEFKDQLSIAQQLLGFFSEMHRRGLIHWDIKLENILYYGGNKIGVTDFGMAFRAAKPSGAGREELQNGFYGTVHGTSPELFANKNFQGDPAKVDAWALGCVLYTLRFNEPPPWERFLRANRAIFADDVEMARALRQVMQHWPDDQRRDVEEKLGVYIQKRLDNKDLSDADKQKIDEITKAYLLEKAREVEQQLGQVQGSDAQAQYQRIIWGLLRLDPKNRLSMADAANELAKIRA